MFSFGCHDIAKIVARTSSNDLMTFWVSESQRSSLRSILVVAIKAPLGDQAAALMSVVCCPLKDLCFSQSETDMTCISFRLVGAAKARPSGCQTTFELASASVSKLFIRPSTFLINFGSSELSEYTYIMPSVQETERNVPFLSNVTCLAARG